MALLGFFGTTGMKEQSRVLGFGDSGYVPLQNDAVLLWDTSAGNVILQLPPINTAPFVFRQSLYYVAKTTTDANTITILPSVGDTIRGGASEVITSAGAVLLYAPNTGNDWTILSNFDPSPVGPGDVLGLVPLQVLFGANDTSIAQTDLLQFLPALDTIQTGYRLPEFFVWEQLTGPNPSNAPAACFYVPQGGNNSDGSNPGGNAGGFIGLGSQGGAGNGAQEGGLGSVFGFFCGPGGDGSATSPGGNGGTASLIGGEPGVDNGGGPGNPGPAFVDSGTGGLVGIGSTNADIVSLGRNGKTIESLGTHQFTNGVALSSVELNADYTPLVTDTYFLAMNDLNINLPDITTVRGSFWWLRKHYVGGQIKFVPDGADTINAGGSVAFTTDFGVVQVYAPSTGTDWVITSMNPVL